MRKIFLFVAALCSSASMLATEQLINGIKYDLDEGELKAKVVAKDPLYTGDIIIPAKVEYDAKTYNVVRIHSNAFQDCVNVTSVSLPEGLVEIGFDAFWHCDKLSSITIPSTVTKIENYAFEYTGLTSFTLPNTVTSVGAYVFLGCTGLTSPIHNDKIFAYMPPSYSGSYNMPEGITTIVESALYNTSSLTAITLPSTLVTIGPRAFANSGISSITIPNSVMEIESGAFESSNLATITFGTGLTQLNSRCFASSKLTSVTIPEGIETINSEVFSDCSSLTTVSLPSTVTDISSSTFQRCTNLENFSIDPGNTHFDTRNGCNALVQSDEDLLVLGFKNSTIPDGIKIIGYDAFKATQITSVVIPSSVKEIRDGAFYNCQSLATCNLPNSVEIVGDRCFQHTALTEPLYNDKIFAFMPTTTEGEITIPDGIVRLAGQSMAGCKGVTKINLPTSLKSIGTDVIWDIDSMRSITLPEGVDSLGTYVFDYCEKLNTITLPSTLRKLDGFTFFHCDSLKTIICYAETPVLDGYNSLYESDVTAQSSVTLYVPDGSVAAYQAADGWSGFTIKAISSIPTAIGNTAVEEKAIKRLVNGQLFIERDGKTFNAQGIEVK